jgi:cell wall assembly regulator SMI1
MAAFEDVASLLECCEVAGPVSEERILAAEKELGIGFPRSYRRFLLTFGAAACGSFEIAGLFLGEFEDEPPLWSDVVAYTKALRRASRGLIPSEYIAISDDGGDYKFYLDTSQTSAEGECPVVVLGPGADDVVVADDFAEFVIRSLKGDLSF